MFFFLATEYKVWVFKTKLHSASDQHSYPLDLHYTMKWRNRCVLKVVETAFYNLCSECECY